MPEWLIPWSPFIGGGILAVIGGGFSLWNVIRGRRIPDRTDIFAQNLKLNEYVDGRIALATAPLQQRVTTLESELEQVKSRETDTKNVVRAWFMRLLWWDQRGRRGPLPLPNAEEITKLGLDDIQSDTLTPSEVQALKETP